MLKNCLNKYVLLIVKTNNAQTLKDDLYGLSWHRINDKMNEKVNPNCISHLVNFIHSIDPNDEIIKRFFDYEKQYLKQQGELKPYTSKKNNLDTWVAEKKLMLI